MRSVRELIHQSVYMCLQSHGGRNGGEETRNVVEDKSDKVVLQTHQFVLAESDRPCRQGEGWKKHNRHWR